MTMRMATIAATALLAAGCSYNSRSGSLSEQFGLSAPAPDPFMVVSRDPLQMPADMNALPAPRPGAPSLVEPNAQLEAQRALRGAGASTAVASASPGESALVAAAGGDVADPSVRDTLAEESGGDVRSYGLDSLLGYEIVQDPEAEAQRLDPRAESETLQAEGITTPVPPPLPDE